MKMQQYDIVMDTPIGGKSGTMTVFFDGSRIIGELELLQQKTPFEGFIYENGKCEIFGRIKTLMKTINYKAGGEITLEMLRLNLEGEHARFRILGVSSKVSN